MFALGSSSVAKQCFNLLLSRSILQNKNFVVLHFDEKPVIQNLSMQTSASGYYKTSSMTIGSIQPERSNMQQADIPCTLMAVCCTGLTESSVTARAGVAQHDTCQLDFKQRSASDQAVCFIWLCK